MKRCLKRFLALAVMLMTFAAMTLAAQAANPTVAARTTGYYYNELKVSGQKRYRAYSLYCEIRVNNITAGGEILKVRFNHRYLDYEIGEDTDGTQYIILSYTGKKNASRGPLKVSFTLSQGGRSYSLSTRVVFRKLPVAMQSLYVGGRDFLGKFPKGVKGLTTKLAGTHPTITYTMKAEYGKAGLRVKRGKRQYKYDAIASLQKGDLILIRYYRKTTRKMYTYQIYVN